MIRNSAVPRSVYIHIPFCRHRCGYCNFSLVAGRDYLVDRFLDALDREVTMASGVGASPPNQKLEVDTVFLGGGTPSHLNSSQLLRLRSIFESRFQLADGAEVTAECNPNDVDERKVEDLISFGVNRISLGVQSLDPAKLKRLERDHSADDVRHAVQLAKQHMKSVSMDLIFAAPEESMSDWRRDLESAMDLQPDHFSTYELTYEKGTQFWNRLQRGGLSLSSNDLRADMYEFTLERLNQTGWVQYELSSFARAGHACQHNQVYWSGAEYFAFGPGASSFIGGIRKTNHYSTMRYLKLLQSGESPVDQVEQLVGLDAARERLVIGLRRLEGVRREEFALLTGVELEVALGEVGGSLVGYGLLELDQQAVRLTKRGVFLSDGVATEILGQS